MKKIISLTILGILLFSCSEDFLNKDPLDFVSPDNYLTNETRLELLVNSIYNNIDFGGTSTEYKRQYPFIYDVMSDNAWDYSTWEGATDFARGTVTANNSRVQWKWDENYQGIARANTVIEQIADKGDEIESDNKARYLAEAKFLRAYYYNDLINFYGDVPLILTPGDLDDAQPSRNPISEVLAQILQDLEDAAADLPLSYDDSGDQGRATKGAALALKARVLLYQSEWQKAADAAEACMDLNVYSLYPDYLGLFLEENETAVSASEAIFQVYYTPITNPSFFNMPLAGWWPSFQPTLQLVDSYYMKNGLPITDPNSGYDPENPFMDRDPRLYASLYYPGGPFHMAMWGMVEDTSRWEHMGMLGLGGFHCRKWINEDLVDINNTEGTNKLFIRYAEVLLTYAEAKNEVSGPDASVYDAIDQLRNRAGMTTLSSAMPGLSKDEMREVIRNERRIELAFEGLRLSDIRRWRIGEEAFVNTTGYDSQFLKTYSYPGDYNGTTEDWHYVVIEYDQRSFNPSRDYLWPIPISEINSNKNMVQNPGYD